MPTTENARDENPASKRIAIVGAGLSGLCLAIELKRVGIHSFVLFEKADDLGGTWAQNIYPNAGCDVPSYLYSYSFRQKTDWKDKYARQPEILSYIRECAEHYHVTPHIRFRTSILRASFDEEDSSWHVESSDGRTERFDFFVSAIGQLSQPYTPDFAGLESFQGTQFHSAEWDESFDPTDKTIAVIGSGASAIQFVPIISKAATKVLLFQRSPNWVDTLNNYSYRQWTKKLFRRIPFAMTLYRFWIFFNLERRFLAFRRGKPTSWLYTKWLRFRLRRQLSEPLRSKMTPNFPAGCKRILLSDEYYDSIKRDNVLLIPFPLDRFTSDAVIARETSHSVDTVIFATGFKTSRMFASMEIVGRNKRTLEEAGQGEARSYLGILQAGFPNFFMLYGPNTNLGHNSIIFMIECQARYIRTCIQYAISKKLRSMEVKEDVAVRYNKMVERRLDKTVWNADCGSWYKTDDGKIINNWCGTALEYWFRTKKVDLSKLRIVRDE